MRALRLHALGGPEVLRVEEVPDPSPAPDSLVIAMRAAGLNFADTRFIRGQYFVRPA
ncbi:MAG: quinone oxidoreductase, partial [Myxococcales bacterium]|nr:quinone oxidoreductase [Myxococcales bacterium]